MFVELIAVAIAGLAMAGILLALGRVAGATLPRWTVPAGAGLAMLAMTIASEYGWYPRNRAVLPDGFEVIQTVEKRSFYQPWTYAAPYVHRFAALDRASVQTHPALPGQHLARLYFHGRWSPVRAMTVAVDCPGRRRAALEEGAGFDAEGRIEGARWIAAAAEDPVLDALCRQDGA